MFFADVVVYGCVFSGYLDVWMVFSAAYGCFGVRVGEVENELVANVEAFFALNKAVQVRLSILAMFLSGYGVCWVVFFQDVPEGVYGE